MKHSNPQLCFRNRFTARMDECEVEMERELSDFEAEGLEVSVAADMVDEGLITDIDEVIS